MSGASRIAAPLLATAALTVAACSTGSLPPYGEALMVIDTDVAVPRFVDRLRVDSFSANGTWIDSHDYAILNDRDWPVSFSVFSSDLSHDTTIVLRLRGYTDARTRDYHGERFIDPAAPPAVPPPDTAAQSPRLIAQDGTDVTPSEEPQPETSIDRLVEVLIHPGQVGSIPILLKGDCVGTMAQLSKAGSFHDLVLAEAQTCIDTSHARVPLAVAQPGPKPSPLPTSVQGTWNKADDCTGSHSSASATCIPGGAFFLGSPDSAGWDVSSMPEHLVLVSRFWIDANEVTVAEWRAAVAKGLQSPDDTPWPLEAPLPKGSIYGVSPCTFSVNPQNRETYPVNCVSWSAARAYCKKAGGDLPTEAQWEYVAAAAGRPTETRYPWGGDGAYPDCSKSVHGRFDLGLPSEKECSKSGYGPQPVNTASGPNQDVTTLGIMNLAGSVTEWTLDNVAAFDAPCWETASPRNPVCTIDGAPHTARGSCWSCQQSANSDRLESFSPGYYHNSVGFRCAYPNAP